METVTAILQALDYLSARLADEPTITIKTNGLVLTVVVDWFVGDPEMRGNDSLFRVKKNFIIHQLQNYRGFADDILNDFIAKANQDYYEQAKHLIEA